MSNNILLIAFDYLPAQNPGVERTHKFARYLKEFGWQPIVLTVNASTYDLEQKDFIDDEHVYRTFCIDVSKHLAYKGKYFSWLKQPDRYVGWALTAIPKGLKLIKQYKPKVIWSTFPVLTSHCIAFSLSKLTGIPWLADYRDPLQSYYDKSVYKKEKLTRWLDKLVIQHCSKVVTVTEGALQLYRQIHPDQAEDKFICIGNGFDQSNFTDLVGDDEITSNTFELYHGGSLYKTGRDPSIILYAIAHLVNAGSITQGDLKLTLEGMNNQNSYQPLVDQLAINDFVFFSSQVSSSKALVNMRRANLLIVVQGEVFNNQIPSKVYEYLATDLPIIALTPEKSETALLLKEHKGCFCTESITALAKQLTAFMSETNKRYCRDTSKYERRSRTRELVDVLEPFIQ